MRINDRNLDRIGPLLAGDPVGLIIDDRYRIERRVARGGMGEILYATDLRFDRPVAMKVMTGELGVAEFARRFEAEAKLMSRIEHPGIVPVFDRGSFPDGRLYFTMKYVKGETLETRMRRKDDLLEVFARVCDIVHFAHERGVIHRDLKPTNIMTDSRGQVYVMDWGIARVRGDLRLSSGTLVPYKPGNTGAGEVLGTLEYMAPEQARGEIDQLDARTDVYSLGAILYEMLAGRPPIVGVDLEQMLQQASTARHVPPREIEPAVPKDLNAICMKALSPLPSDRYGSAAEFGAAIRERKMPVSSRPTRRWIPIAAAIVALAAIGGWTLHRQFRHRPSTADRPTDVASAELLDAARPKLDRAIKYFRVPDADYAELVRRVDEVEAILRPANTANAHFLMGRCWELKGRDDLAEASWRTAIQLDPTFGAPRFRLARLWTVQDYFDQLVTGAAGRRRESAIREFEAALASPGFVDPLDRHAASGFLAYLRADWPALDGIAKPYEEQVGAEDLHWLAAMARRDDERRKALDRAIELCAFHILARVTRGFELLDRDSDGAARDFSAAVRMRPATPTAYFGRALATKDAGAARADYERALEVAPADWPGRAIVAERLRK